MGSQKAPDHALALSSFFTMGSQVTVLGRGQYGVILSDNDTTAKKRIQVTDEGLLSSVVKETLGSRVPCEENTLLQYSSISRTDSSIIEFEMPRMKSCLEKRIESRDVSEEELWKLIGQVSSQLYSQMCHGFMHCDIKPSNILLDEQNDYHICDFGIGCLWPVTPPEPCMCATLWQRSPELLQFEANRHIDMKRPKEVVNGKAAHVWQLGVTIMKCILSVDPMTLINFDVSFGRHHQRVCDEPAQSVLQRMKSRCLVAWETDDVFELDDNVGLSLETTYSWLATSLFVSFESHLYSERLLKFVSRMVLINPLHRISLEEVIQESCGMTFSVPKVELIFKSQLTKDFVYECENTDLLVKAKSHVSKIHQFKLTLLPHGTLAMYVSFMSKCVDKVKDIKNMCQMCLKRFCCMILQLSLSLCDRENDWTKDYLDGVFVYTECECDIKLMNHENCMSRYFVEVLHKACILPNIFFHPYFIDCDIYDSECVTQKELECLK